MKKSLKLCSGPIEDEAIQNIEEIGQRQSLKVIN